MSQESEVGAGHQHGAFGLSAKCGVGAELEFPFVVFHPAVFLLHFLLVACGTVVARQL